MGGREHSAALVEFGAPPLFRMRMAHTTDNLRSVTAVSFTRLLERLHPDRDQAAAEYEPLRRALVKFFDWRGVWPADECADDTLDRLARKLEGTHVEDVQKYVRGIARLVLLERRRAPKFSPLEDALPTTAAPVPE